MSKSYCRSKYPIFTW